MVTGTGYEIPKGQGDERIVRVGLARQEDKLHFRTKAQFEKGIEKAHTEKNSLIRDKTKRAFFF